ncbi:uroporphyrinogen-III C-methyltransferase [Flexivirga sp. ID2601S]|uniref:uroporphyrinogen-III C-methyltransferase n=1 Tax=Flexivirga aerilata TaxID=1656889 RepID=A0A849AEC6_9MICO|nr:uroporphyrinogen-III C-methyltransferase [Flexivirga aerilata]NNG38789.1 uroporphyrinogen-III C-methyltransferase [Flexivirga aerilata]
MTEFVALDLSGRRAVVVGGGPRSAQRVTALLAEGAVVRVVAPALCEELRTRYAEPTSFEWTAREAEPADLDDAWWVAAPEATDAERETIAGWAAERRVFLEQQTARVLDQGDLDTLVTESAISLRQKDSGGKVVLVGGGPGADDLITVRGRRELARADVVVTDRLAPVGLLRELGSTAEVIDVGKTPHHHPVPQAEINELLIERARRGDYVVRLKGGDPFLLGRGGEELLACRSAGVSVEVVPGVTSAFAAPAAASVPVTHRGVAHGVLVISGHDDLDVPTLAAWQQTIVVLMGMGRLRELAAALVGAGKPGDTPVTVVHRAWTPQQRVVTGDLLTIADRVAEEGVGNPSAIVIGDVTRVFDEG